LRPAGVPGAAGGAKRILGRPWRGGLAGRPARATQNRATAPRSPRQIILDLDATDDPLHGEQKGRFSHAYYDCYCYLQLSVFCGRHLLVAELRSAAMGLESVFLKPDRSCCRWRDQRC
jgi:hypothetical protein